MNVREMQKPTTGWLLAEDPQAPLSLTYILYFQSFIIKHKYSE